MKKILSLIITVFCALSLFAQAPEKFSYQAVVRNTNNSLVSNAQVGVRVNILQGSATGDAVYSESHVVSSNANGLITINIGGGSVLHGNFESIDWSDGPYFLKTDIDPNGCNDYTITSTQQLLSVPYALYSKEAGNGFSGDYNDLTNLPQIPQSVGELTNDANYITLEQVPAQVNADWNATEGAAQIFNKPELFSGDYNDLSNTPTIPTIPTNVSAFNNDAGYLTGYTETDPQFNAWDKDYNELINKPTIPTVPTDISVFNNDAGYITMDSVPAIPTNVSAFTNDAGYLTNFTEQQVLSISHDTLFLTGGSFVKLPAGFDGDYNSLTNKPTIPSTVGELTNDANYITLEQVPAQVNADWNAMEGAAQILNKPEIFSGDYNDLSNTPTIPTNVSAFSNDAGYLTGYTETDPQFNAWDKDYNDLINKPIIPTIPTDVSVFNNDAGYLTEVAPQTLLLSGDQLTITGGNTVTIPISSGEITQLPVDWNATSGVQMILNKPNLATVATTGNYNDLTNKPTIPAAANNATLTIQNNGSDIGTFTADASTSQIINVIVPTTTSELTNNSGFITSAALPTNVSQLNNDAGYITVAQCGDVDICAMANQLAQLQQQMVQMQARLDSLEGNTFTCGTSTVSDHEGNVYNTVQIGNQCWTKENLRTTTSPSTGTYIITNSETGLTYTGKQACWYNNDSTTYAPMNYGLLYNWNAAVDTFNTAYGETSVHTGPSYAVSVTFNGHRRGICPVGWHLPSDAEWTTMTDYVGSQSEYMCGGNTSYIAKALADSVGWDNYTDTCAVGNNQSSNNTTGFSAVPAFEAGVALFWSATQEDAGNPEFAWCPHLLSSSAIVAQAWGNTRMRCSIRCLKD